MRYFIIPIFVPHLGCPYQCVFCDQKKISGAVHSTVTPDTLKERVELFLQTWEMKQSQKTQIAFYGGSFTNLDSNIQESLLRHANTFIKNGQVNSIRVSTRPDSITPDNMCLLKDYGVETIELGVQSMVDSVLKLSGRGHTSLDVERAVETIKSCKVEVGLQIMPGLPGDTPEHLLRTVRKIVKMKPDFVRIYPTLVIKGTPLEELYLRGSYTPMTLEEAVGVSKNALLTFENADIQVVRLGLQWTAELEREKTVVAGPFHSSFRHLVESSIFLEMATRLLEKCSQPEKNPIFRVNTKDYSYFCGQRKKNIAQLKEMFNMREIQVSHDQAVQRGALEILTASSEFSINRKELILKQ